MWGLRTRMLAQMEREMRAGNWLREGRHALTGKTLGLIGFRRMPPIVCGIALGSGMRVIAWNRDGENLSGRATL